MWIITLLLLILILGIIILVHEFGHFITAKMFGVYIYEFSIGMGPIIKTHKGKDGINYNIRAFPIGGFVSMAGEVYEDDETNKIPKDKFMCNKKWWQRIIILGAGVFNNFVLAILILFTLGFMWGAQDLTPVIREVVEDSAASQAGMQAHDVIVAVNNHKVFSWDQAQILLYMKDRDGIYDVTVRRNGEEKVLNIKPEVTTDENGQKQNTYGIYMEQNTEEGIIGYIQEAFKVPEEITDKEEKKEYLKTAIPEYAKSKEISLSNLCFSSLKYAFQKFASLISTMWMTVINLFTGKIALNNLSGPVGIYQVVGDSLAIGLNQIVYLIAFLSINVGLINILPIPAFDGGRIFFLIIEKIKGSPINAKFENWCHTIFFFLLIALMIYITVFDIIRF